jgi:hypothetical protein
MDLRFHNVRFKNNNFKTRNLKTQFQGLDKTLLYFFFVFLIDINPSHLLK